MDPRRTVVGIVVALAFACNGAWAQGAAEAVGWATAADRRFCEDKLHGQIWARTELYFGLSRPDGRPDITEDEFQEFLDTEVTPRFPDGLTLLTGNGQFRGSSGVIIQERSKLLILFYPWSNARNVAVERIRTLYKRDFLQEAVLRVDDTSCVSF